MNFGEAVVSCLKHYANGTGRAPRSEYWWWFLFTILGAWATTAVDVFVFGVDIKNPEAFYPLNTIFTVLTLLPSITVALRRLQDTDRSGWWVLISLTIIGIIPLLYWACQKGTEGPNRFDEIQPKKKSGAGRTLLMIIVGVLVILAAIVVGIVTG